MAAFNTADGEEQAVKKVSAVPGDVEGRCD